MINKYFLLSRSLIARVVLLCALVSLTILPAAEPIPHAVDKLDPCNAKNVEYCSDCNTHSSAAFDIGICLFTGALKIPDFMVKAGMITGLLGPKVPQFFVGGNGFWPGIRDIFLYPPKRPIKKLTIITYSPKNYKLIWKQTFSIDEFARLEKLVIHNNGKVTTVPVFGGSSVCPSHEHLPLPYPSDECSQLE